MAEQMLPTGLDNCYSDILYYMGAKEGVGTHCF